MDIRLDDRFQYQSACSFASQLRRKLDDLKACRDSFIFLEGFQDHIHDCDLFVSGTLEDVIDDVGRLLEALNEAITAYQESDRDADVVARPSGVEAA